MTRADKNPLFSQLTARLESALAALQAASAAAAEAATHEDSKPENKYDTRGLEASYLAGAQKERVADLQSSIEALKNTPLRSFHEDEAIGLTALIELEHAGVQSLCLLMRVGAGIELDFDGRKAVTVTMSSPLGKALLGKRSGDFATVATAQGDKDYEILAVW